MRKRWMRHFEKAVLCGMVLAVTALPFQARAALGEPESTAATDAQQLKGSIKSTSRSTYQVHEIELPSGTVLREYAAGGTVFAVAWKGPAMPDLRQALGRYFDVYVGALKVKRAGRGQSSIQQGGLVVQSSGHMRAFSGRAYVLQAVPAGTSMDEVR
jgi:Protein of unknown function (DUF2844)